MSADTPAPRFRALVAEDYADFRARLLALLSHLPVDWVAVADGEAAVEVVRDTSAPLDLLITDLDMP
ncbi:MAG TPA: hypothetical protein VNN12_09460, partial [Dehalococcoidia bacterium]|nr:hypothetical protein [Dehalococcoidia bacterium]